MKLTQSLLRALRSGSTESREAAYLNDATSLTDLERRQREIDQGRFRPRSFPR